LNAIFGGQFDDDAATCAAYCDETAFLKFIGSVAHEVNGLPVAHSSAKLLPGIAPFPSTLWNHVGQREEQHSFMLTQIGKSSTHKSCQWLAQG
jgi:hypothetical protein